MPSILLDTHILVWWRSDLGRLNRQQARLLERVDHERPAAISAITLWELAKMVERKRLEIGLPLQVLLEQIESHPSLELVPITARIAAESVNLGEDFHNDPADQIIVATARCLGLTLLTADERIRRWGKVRVA